MNKSNQCIMDENEEIILIDSEDEILPTKSINKWKVLIVDDDEYVHSITKLSLNDLVYKDKSMDMVSAYSAKEAIEILEKDNDIVLIFVDVVMEEDDSGLKLVRYIRDKLENKLVRIILRTGQPGQAPEKRVIVEYDINDYKLKTELTADKLFVTVVSALRSYNDLEKLEQNRKGLEQIIDSSATIFKEKSLNDFIAGVLSQLASIMGIGKKAMFLSTSGFTAKKNNNEFIVQSAIGEYSQHINKCIDNLNDEEISRKITQAANTGKSIYSKDSFVTYLKSQFGEENIIYMKTNIELLDLDKELVEIFLTNISIALDNLYIDNEMASTQREIIYTLGEIAEARSKEIGNHVKRVAKYSELFALKLGLSDEESETIKLATAMHDIGKLTIPDSILNKPGKLTDEEFEIMKTHSKAGYEMLKNSKGRIMEIASIVAYQHHEKFNGKGYPLGLKGEDISIYGRISAISDVFDALGSDRVYKAAWKLDRILDYLKQEKGSHFDPYLIDMFIENLDEFLAIRDELKD